MNTEDMRHDSDARRRWLRRPVMWLCVVGLTAAIVIVLLAGTMPAYYGVVTLPSYGGKPFHPHAINDHNQIVGRVTTAGGKSGVALWDREHGIRELGIVAGEGPLMINNRGQVAGPAVDPNGGTRVFLWDPQTGLTLLGQRGSRAVAINNRGQVAGDSGMEPGPPHAILWEGANGMRDLNPPDSQGSIALHLNDSGQILGSGSFGARGLTQRCFWDLADPNFMDWMSFPDKTHGYRDLNNGGYVLDEEFRPEERPGMWPQRYAMLWHKDREPTWLFPLVDLDAHVAILNDVNQVVYYEKHRPRLSKWFPHWFPPCQRPFLWDPVHGSISLERGLRLGKADDFAVCDLNNEGCIVGVVSSAKGRQKRVILLDPIARKWRK